MHRPLAGLVLVVVLLTSACATAGDDPTPASSPSAAPTATPLGRSTPTPGPTPVPDPEDPSPSPTPVPQPTIGTPDADRALRLATLLARDVGPRPAGSDADGVARLAVAAWLRRAGWLVEEQPFPLPQGGRTANLVATWGDRGRDEPHVVIGAHLDTVDGSPGGNDNASGIGALVTVAEELADEAADLPVPVVLVAFGAEEYQPSTPRVHHLGSEHYAARDAADVVAMLSLDMIGHGPLTCICWFGAGPRTLADRLARVAGTDGYRVERRGDISDHGPFARRGIPAAFLWTYMEPRFHSPADAWEHLDPDAIDRATRLTIDFIRGLRDTDVGGLAADA